jgi:hypothetical protein
VTGRAPWFAAHRRGFVSRLRWTLMPWLPFAWRYHDDYEDAPNPGRWWHHCIGSAAWWMDKLLERLPGGALFDPLPVIVCGCDDCLAAEAAYSQMIPGPGD